MMNRRELLFPYLANKDKLLQKKQREQSIIPLGHLSSYNVGERYSLLDGELILEVLPEGLRAFYSPKNTYIKVQAGLHGTLEINLFETTEYNIVYSPFINEYILVECENSLEAQK